jgi:hypothetical protein
MEPGYVKIINPVDGSVAEVPQISMPHHYRAGWRLLTDDEIAAADQPEPDPKPMTKAQAAKAAKAANAESEDK